MVGRKNGRKSSTTGHFFIVEPSWQIAKDKEEYLGDDGVLGILIAVEDVRWVEFIPEQHPDGKKSV